MHVCSLLSLVVIIGFLLAAAFIFQSCSCKSEEKGDDINDDTDDDTDDDNTDDDDDDDAEGWHIYTIIEEDYPRNTSIAVDQNNKVHISYNNAYAYLKYATNASGSWQVVKMTSTLFASVNISIAVDSNGKAHICCSDIDVLKYVTNKSGSWQIYDIADTGEGLGSYCSLALDSSKKVHIAYHYCELNDDNPPSCQVSRLKYITNKSGLWQDSTIDDGNQDLGIKLSLALDSNDKAHICYWHPYDTGVVKYATNAGKSWQRYTIDRVKISNFFDGCDIAVDSNDKAHISYPGWETYGLRYATNESGSWQIFIVDSAASGDHNSIAIGSNNKAHMSYQGSGLKYATNVSGSWEKTAVDTTSGSNTSIAIDSNDYVHISYRGDDGALRYATNRPPEK